MFGRKKKKSGTVILEFQGKTYILRTGDTFNIIGRVTMDGDARGTMELIPYQVKVVSIG